MIYALVTLYKPNDSVLENIKSLSIQVDKVYLLDNSPNSNGNLYTSISNQEYFFFNANLGLSGAFNKLFNEKMMEEDDFIIFFDQDSHIQEGYIKKLVSEYEELEKNNVPVGCLGPMYFNTSSGQIEIPKEKKKINDNTYSVKSIITSSMLVRYKNIKEIGFWNDKVFLDMADWDLCWRFIANKKLCCITNVVTLQHTLGIGERKIGFLRVKKGNPFRTYYQIRDCLYLLKEKYVPFKYRIRFILMLTVRPILHFLFLDDKKERISYFKKGIRDYKKGIHGSL